MDRETIYLDNDEEITSAVDKLKSAETSVLDLVIPKEALLLQSVVNLKLLKKQAESLGKEITIVTQDKVGRKLAEQIGIPVVEKVGDAPKVVKMSEAEEKPTEEDIEFKTTQGKAKEEEKEPVEFKEEAIVAPTSEVVTAAAEKAKVEDLPKEELEKAVKEGKEKKKKKWKRWALAGGFSGLALLVLAYLYVPLANITLKVAAENKKVDFNFVADKEAQGVDNATQTIPAREVAVETEKTQKFPATGKKKVGTKATGSIKLYNNYSTTAKSLDAGNKIIASGGQIFTLNSNVTVPGYTDPGGGKVAGTAEVAVTANAVGSEYNLSQNTKFSVPKYDSPDFYAYSVTAFSGGESRDVTYVTQNDINNSKTELAKIIEGELRSKAAEEVREGERLLEKAVKITELEATPSLAVNAEGNEFDLKGKSKLISLVFKDDDLKKLAENYLAGEIGETKEIVESGSLISATEFVEGDVEKGEIKGRLSGEAYIATKIEEDKIKIDISGDKEGKVLEYLNNMEGVEEAEIRFFPRFYKRVPRIKNHIYLKLTILKTQEE